MPDPKESQIGGEHYSSFKVQPIEFITANNLDFIEGNIIKYIVRHSKKDGAQDVRKAIHYCRLLLKLKYGANE